MRVRLLAVVLLLTHCAVTAILCPPYSGYRKKITDYEVHVDAITDAGIAVDTSGFDVRFSDIDLDTEEVERCLAKQLGSSTYRISRCSFTVKIAHDWYISECTGTQLFPCDVPETGCGPFSCICECTGAVQGASVIVSTPNLMSYKHELIHLVTGLGEDEHDNEAFKCDSLF